MPKKKSETDVVRGQLLNFDTEKVYKQLGYAVQAVKTCTIAMTALMDDVLLTREEQALGKALAGRAQAVATEANEILRLALHLKSSRSELQKKILTSSCEATRVTFEWFKRFLEEHTEEQIKELRPIAEEMEVMLRQLTGLKRMKVEEAAQMEIRLEKYQKALRRKQGKTIPRTTVNPEFQDLTQTPLSETGLDIKALVEGATAEISGSEDRPKPL